ncbi:MAG TPA: hypothetical protein VHD38_02180 [Candidatus Paceibacterota bacterium]|jgi:hypothetical protein|nr:hypothetical protein [Candidatus Paceibacterota bacterium]
MEHGPESAPRPSRLDELRESIVDAPARIEREFERTGNSWLACFGSSVFIIETQLASPRLQAVLPAEQYARATERLENIKIKLSALKEQYPTQEALPPEEIKAELLRELDILSE